MEEEICLPRCRRADAPTQGISRIALWRERAGQLWKLRKMMGALRGRWSWRMPIAEDGSLEVFSSVWISGLVGITEDQFTQKYRG